MLSTFSGTNCLEDLRPDYLSFIIVDTTDL
jgi:hypothetical protein